jgi:glycosyltransferase involved in cell wall biosynthesis
MRRPTVLFLNRVYPPSRGASGRVLRDLARSMAREGWQVTVITTGPKTITERDGAVRVIRIKSRGKPRGGLGYLWVWARLLIEALKLPKTHAVVTLTDPPFLVIAGSLISKIKGSKHIHWCQDLYPDLFGALGVKVPGFIESFLKNASRKAMKGADKVIVIGRCMARHLSFDGFDPKQITVIPNWPDNELVRPANDKEFVNRHARSVEGARSHEEQHKHGPRFRVLYAGNIGRAHPVESILNAAANLNESHPDIEFVFVGDGPRHEMINRERIKRNLDNIRLMPYQPNSRLKSLMESGDVHLVSMDEEAAGMLVPVKFYSSLSAHRPCIFVGPTQSETAKVISDFKAGSVVPQGDTYLLEKEIRQYRENSDKWFTVYEGAKSASSIFLPKESINAWIERAWAVIEDDVKD